MRYSTIVADPPWAYSSPKAVVGNGGRGSQGGRAASIIQANVEQHYPVMRTEELKALPIAGFAEDNAHLYLWTTNSFIVDAHDIARAWGFVPKTIITWVKTQHEDPTKLSMKTGYWYRSATEHCLFAVRGKLRLAGRATPTAFMHKRLPHSVKPDSFLDLVEEQSPGPYLELFARRRRAGWSCWGNEVESDISIPTSVNSISMEITGGS